MINLAKARQGAMLKFSTNKLMDLPRSPLSLLKTGQFFTLHTNRSGTGACYTKFLVCEDGTALAVERSATKGERGKFGDPYKFSFTIADEITRNPSVNEAPGVHICYKTFGN